LAVGVIEKSVALPRRGNKKSLPKQAGPLNADFSFGYGTKQRRQV
jgi:hypothetical protein